MPRGLDYWWVRSTPFAGRPWLIFVSYAAHKLIIHRRRKNCRLGLVAEEGPWHACANAYGRGIIIAAYPLNYGWRVAASTPEGSELGVGQPVLRCAMSTKRQMDFSLHGVFQPIGGPAGNVDLHSSQRDALGKSRSEVADTIRADNETRPVDYRPLYIGIVQVRAIARALAGFGPVEDDRPDGVAPGSSPVV